jgi:hypothetical protein
MLFDYWIIVRVTTVSGRHVAIEISKILGADDIWRDYFSTSSSMFGIRFMSAIEGRESERGVELHKIKNIARVVFERSKRR